MSKKSKLEAQFAECAHLWGLPEPEREYRFAQEALGRKWRFDFSWPEYRVAVELDGGTWVRGRHVAVQVFQEIARR